MRDPTQEELVAAELMGTLVQVCVKENPDVVKFAQEFLASGRPYHQHTPGTEVYSFLDDRDEDADFDPYGDNNWQALVHVWNTDPPKASCRLIEGTEHWDLERDTLGPFVFRARGKLVMVTVEADE